jgi:hypothetical protein
MAFRLERGEAGGCAMSMGCRGCYGSRGEARAVGGVRLETTAAWNPKRRRRHLTDSESGFSLDRSGGSSESGVSHRWETLGHASVPTMNGFLRHTGPFQQNRHEAAVRRDAKLAPLSGVQRSRIARCETFPFLPDSQHQGPWFGSESFEALVSVPHHPAGAPWLHGHADAAVGYCELDPVASVVTAVRQGDCVGCNCNVSLIG